jgi:hypothetical protein
LEGLERLTPIISNAILVFIISYIILYTVTVKLVACRLLLGPFLNKSAGAALDQRAATGTVANPSH